MASVSTFKVRNYPPAFSCFSCGGSFLNEFFLAIEIWPHALDNTIYIFLVKLFPSFQILIFVACTAFDPLFFALWQEGLGIIYLIYSSFCWYQGSQSYLLVHHVRCTFVMIISSVLLLEHSYGRYICCTMATNVSSLLQWYFASKILLQ